MVGILWGLVHVALIALFALHGFYIFFGSGCHASKFLLMIFSCHVPPGATTAGVPRQGLARRLVSARHASWHGAWRLSLGALRQGRWLRRCLG